MAVRRMRLGLTLTVLSVAVGVATAQETLPGSPGTPSKRHHAGKPVHASAPAASTSTDQVWHDLVRGSSEQQQMERTDNDLAGVKPIDHRKDDFFSDWRGLR